MESRTMIAGENKINWETYRAEFPITDRYIYFDNAAVSPLSTRVRKAIDGLSDALSKEGVLCAEKAFGRVKEVRSSVAQFVGAAPEEIAFTKNTTQGVLLAANGMQWNVGDNVVMPAIEFPANVYPWIALGRRGVETRMVEPERGRVTAEMIADRCDDRTRAVTVSFVQFSTGYRIDLEALGDFCRTNNIYLHVDGIQSLGMIPCDVRKLKVDFMSAGSHKWLLSPPGTGIFYCRNDLMGKMDVSNPGWTSVVDSHTFLDYDLTYREDAGRFEEGSLNIHGIHALGASVDRFLEIGMTMVEKRILSLTDLLDEGLTRLGFTVTSPRKASERSGIICFSHTERKSDELHKTLSDAGVVCSLSEGAIRLSPHFYNNEAEVKKLLDILQKK
ncbi:MAG: aminotransferase class V-fold PLP-dependent enzyme [Candidatus Krumholzibacteria bacterium]|nr:aminotransferase class V-fold PLP-dependent enzyme [Candidatus Krumholzibacteria bacterium]